MKLAELLNDTAPAANSANSANLHSGRRFDSQLSQDSQASKGINNAGTRLMGLAEGLAVEPHLVDSLTSDDLADCIGQSDEILTAYLKGLQDTADRRAGRIPHDYIHEAECRQCGPVWLFTPGTVDGCPWCWNRAQGLPIPRPKVSNPEFDA